MGGLEPSAARYRGPVTIGSILFAAGEGKRLRPLTLEVAKPALPLLDVPLGSWGLMALLEVAGPVVVNASHQARGLEAALRQTCPDGWELFYEGPEGLGTGGTVAALAERREGPVVVYNGDLVTDLDVHALLATHEERGAGITLAVRAVSSGADVAVDAGDITGFIDRRVTPDAEGAQYVGVAIIEAEVARRISKTVPLGLGESVFAPLAERGWLAAHLHDGYVLDVGTIDRYLEASRDALSGRLPAPPLPWPGVLLEVEGGRAYLGPGADAAEGSLGPGAVVLSGAVVAEGSYVEAAVVWPKEVVTPGHEVRGAVWIDDGAIEGSSARRAP